MKKYIFFLALSVLLLVGCLFYKETVEGSEEKKLFFVVDNNLIQEKIYCFYNQADGYYYLFLPSYADLKSVKINIGKREICLFERDEAKIFLHNGEDLHQMRFDQTYHFYYMSRDDSIMEEGTLVIMKSANLPALFIETGSGNMESVDADKEYKEQGGHFTLVNETGAIECRDALEHITGRGNSTWYTDKKSYGVKLQNGADLFHMGYADKWVLLPNIQDEAYIRNKMTYDMALAAGMEGAAKSKYIDLYLNHEYHGMYQLCEKIEIGENRIPANNLEAKNKYANEDYDYAEPFGDEWEKGILLQTTPENITGGYLLERDVKNKYSVEKSGFKTRTLEDCYTIKSPERASETQVAYIKALFEDAERAIVAEDGKNPDTGRSYLEYIDLESFAQKYIIEELSRNNGGGASSSFFYKPNDEISTKIFGGPVWDYDKAYGILKDYNANTKDLGYLTLRVEATQLFKELYKHPEFQAMVRECYVSFFSGYVEELCQTKIDEYAAEIKVSAKMDEKRWQSQREAGSKRLCSADTLDERIQYIKDFIAARKEFLDVIWGQNIQGNENQICNVTFLGEDFYRNTTLGVRKGERLEAVPNGSADSISQGHSELVFQGWYNVDTGEMFDIAKPVKQDMILIGKWDTDDGNP